jgi:tricorn protease
MRFMDVSDEQITFVYGGDIWLVAKAGGTAFQLTNSPGEESYPRFSPDGSEIAYTASYNGNEDIYVMPVTGGVPTRVTYQSHRDRMVDWHPDGQHILFASARASGTQRVSRFFLVDKSGGMPEMLNVPYGEMASFSPDGSQIAYVTRLAEDRPFKRYRGGFASDVYVYDLINDTAINITDSTAVDAKPSWIDDKIFYLSDRDASMRLNIWSYDVEEGSATQITKFDDFDISYLGASENDLVFAAGGQLYHMETDSLEPRPVQVSVVSDFVPEMARSEDVSSRISSMTVSPAGERVLFEARGEIFNVPAEKGFALNLTQSSAAFDHSPAWSPDGQSVAYWSDQSGEYQIHLQSPDGNSTGRQLTSRDHGFGYDLFWSPDSSRISFIDETNTIFVIDVETGSIREAGRNLWNLSHPGRGNYSMAWSPDSRWLTFDLGMENTFSALFIYDAVEAETHQVSSGYYSDHNPVFSADGKYLLFLTSRNFSAVYSDLDGTWVYPNTTRLAAISLMPDAPSLLPVFNDAVEAEESNDDGSAEEGNNSTDTAIIPAVAIDFTDMEARLELLPPAAGNFDRLFPLENKLAYIRQPNTGSADEDAKLVFYDFEDQEEKVIIADVDGAVPTADGLAFLVESNNRYGLVQAQPEQKITDPVPTDGLVMQLVPREEWQQIYDDTWRRYRDFFYDPNMHGLDWDALYEQYGALLTDARTRWDVQNIQFHLLGETSAGHTYVRDGDVERAERVETGYLGIDWQQDGGLYRIGRIVKPAIWDTEVRSPFDKTGMDIEAGHYILAVNGVRLDTAKDPYADFEGLSGKTVSLLVSDSGEQEDAHALTLKTLTQSEETLLRQLEWIESNRLRVEELSGGRLGYIYMTNTADRGQLELVRMYYGQLDKDGFVIDERFNGGGQLADRFLELLQRPTVYNLHWRHGADQTQPPEANPAPLGMLINGWAASGGDGLPWAFDELEAGPIVGENTMGILVGPATGHTLIDGGGITVPGARLYDNDGHWFWEGEGVSPDIEVWDNPELLAQGRDPQLERLVAELMTMLETAPPRMTPAPQLEDRTAASLRTN